MKKIVIRNKEIIKKYYIIKLISMRLHTYTNKLTGLLLFFIPYFMNLNGANIIVHIIGVIALISSIEELAINIKSKKLDLNKKSIFN